MHKISHTILILINRLYTVSQKKTTPLYSCRKYQPIWMKISDK